MIATAHPTSSSAAAMFCAPVTPSLELREARQARDVLATLLGREQSAMAEFLLALSDFDRRRGWEPLGHASLFAFLHHGLGLPNGPAFHRMSAARLLQRFPEVIEPLRDGRLCLTTVAELSKVLTEANRAELLPRFFRLSSREAQELVAELQPRPAPPMKTVVTAVERSADMPAMASSLAGRTETTDELQRAPATPPVALLASEVTLTHPARGVERRDQVEPLDADLRRLHVTVSRQLLSQLEAAREGLSHAIPGATTEQVLQAALALLLEKQARARGQVERPRKAATTSAPTETPTAAPPSPAPEPGRHRLGPREHIPADLRRAVWERDQGRCTWPLDGGGVCGSTHRLEIDHRVPRALGGQTELGNLRLLCERHNKLAARLAYGERWMGRYARGQVAPGRATTVRAGIEGG